MENAIGVKTIGRRIGLESKVDYIVEHLATMLNNNTKRKKNKLTLVFRGIDIPNKVLDCYGDAKLAEEKLYKLSEALGYKRMTAEVDDEGEGKITAYISF